MAGRQPLVAATELRDQLLEPDPPTLLDVRWSLGGSGGHDAYVNGHLPHATFLDLDADLAGQPGEGGRHPLPDPADLQAALRRAGVREGHPTVVYDAGGAPPSGAAARAWWILRWAGIEDVRVLDGGYQAWTGETTTEVTIPAAGDVTVRPGAMPTLDAAHVHDHPLLDARSPERYRGEVEPIDPVAGHIPGARNLPMADTVDADGRLKPVDELRELVRGTVDGETVGTYCGSGVTAAHLALALTVAGYQPVLYVGSWSNWITDPARPVARGES
jgi:thiosulfate/3-mercaptopyruvate sulfurtransferase